MDWWLSKQRSFYRGRLTVPAVVLLGMDERALDKGSIVLWPVVQQCRSPSDFVLPVVRTGQEAVFPVRDCPRERRSGRGDGQTADNGSFKIFEFRFAIGENVVLQWGDIYFYFCLQALQIYEVL